MDKHTLNQSNLMLVALSSLLDTCKTTFIALFLSLPFSPRAVPLHFCCVRPLLLSFRLIPAHRNPCHFFLHPPFDIKIHIPQHINLPPPTYTTIHHMHACASFSRFISELSRLSSIRFFLKFFLVTSHVISCLGFVYFIITYANANAMFHSAWKVFV